MRSPTPLPSDLGVGPFSVAQARDAGVTRTRTRASDLAAPFRGVRMRSGSVDLETMCVAYAVRMADGQVFSHATAARLAGLPLPRGAEEGIHVAAPWPQRQPRVRGVIGHRLGDGIRTAVVRGLPVVAAGDAWCQLATSLGVDELVEAGDRLVGWPKPLMRIAEVDAAIARFGRRRGAAALRAARLELRPGSASPRETRLRLLVQRAGFPEPECNGEIVLSTGEVTYGDLVFRAQRVVLEYDGEQHRDDIRQFTRDVRRLNALSLDGWTVIRVARHDRGTDILRILDRALRPPPTS